MKTYYVTIPIAGHITFEVEASCETDAKDKAFEMDSESGDLTWEMLESFNSGNVCHCPSPWEVDVSL